MQLTSATNSKSDDGTMLTMIYSMQMFMNVTQCIFACLRVMYFDKIYIWIHYVLYRNVCKGYQMALTHINLATLCSAQSEW